MTDLARALGEFRVGSFEFRVASDCRIAGIVNPSMPSPPTLSMWRREKRVAWKLAQAEKQFDEFMASISQNEFFRVEQTPGQVFEGLPEFFGLFEVLERRRR